MAQKVFKVGHYHLAMTNLLFSHELLLHESFLHTDLGKIYQAIPFNELASVVPAPKSAAAPGAGRQDAR